MSTQAWIVVTVADVKAYLVSAQMVALQTAALGAGQADPFDTVMPTVAMHIRAKVATCERNLVSDTANSVPPELLACACYLIIGEMQTRLVGLKLTEEQNDQIEYWRAQLDLVAACKYEVSLPADAVEPPTQSGPPVEVVTYTTRVATREKLGGLL